MSARILVVDDTPLNVKLLTAKLAQDFYIVTSAENGREALEKVAAEKPDLILLDVMMPEMDGFETCRRLKADPATAFIPVVIITALSDVADRVRGLAAGADDFLGKPINDLALMSRIRSLLRTKVLMDEWRMREATALQLSPGNNISDIDPLNVRDSHVLIVDDKSGSPTDGAFIEETLRPLSAHIAQVSSVAEAEQALADGSYDLVFSNLDLQSQDGLMICSRLRTNPVTRHIPILLIANNEDISRVAKGLDLGANDYLMRPLDTHELFARTRTQLRHKRNYDRLRNGFEQNMMMALVDPLTGCFNRRYLDAHLPRYIKNAAEIRKPISVQMIDIDFFKKVNDGFGHAAGDEVLKEVARRISNGVRPSDFFVRMGGEEFAVIMPSTSIENAFKIAERLRHSVAEKPIAISGQTEELTVTISIGLAATNPHTETDAHKVFDRADAALYSAKQNGRNKTVAAEAV